MLGLEAGYAKALNKPILVVAKNGSGISNTISGTATNIQFYENVSRIDLSAFL